MTHLSRAGVLSLFALTLHYSVLSIMLHLSRSMPGARYHASSAIALTEFFKIIVAGLLVLWSGELRPAMNERRRMLWEQDERKALGESSHPIWLGEEKANRTSQEDSKELKRSEERHDWMVMSEQSPSPTSGRKVSTTLRIDASLAQTLGSEPATPQLTLIPATPAPEPSPVGPLDVSGLYPTRQAFEWRAKESQFIDVVNSDWWRTLRESVWSEGWWKLAFVAALFMLQGNLQYVASGNLSVPLFQLAYQLKIPATAMCSVILLKKVLSQQQWASLFVLTFGVGIVQIYSATGQPKATAPSTPLAVAHDSGAPNQFLGLVAVMAACVSSGFASCLFEQILKAPPTPTSSPTSSRSAHSMNSSRPSIWVRNIQLSIFGLIAGLPVVMWEMRSCASGMDEMEVDPGWWGTSSWAAATAAGTFFDGFNCVTWIVIFLQVTGGLLGALVVKHADNLLKCFSTSMSILLSVIASVFLFDFQVNLGILVGSMLVLGATYVYTSPSSREQWRWRPSSHPPSTSILSTSNSPASFSPSSRRQHSIFGPQVMIGSYNGLTGCSNSPSIGTPSPGTSSTSSSAEVSPMLG